MVRQNRLMGSEAATRRQNEHLQDEVYRQVFRLEANRPFAELDLAIALLRAWLAASSATPEQEDWLWLKNICPIGVTMIEDAKRKRLKVIQ